MTKYKSNYKNMLWVHYIICDIDDNIWGVEKRKRVELLKLSA